MNNVNKCLSAGYILSPYFRGTSVYGRHMPRKKREHSPAKRRYCLPVYTVSEHRDTVEKLVTFE